MLKSIKGNIMLIIAALIWGFAFVAQSIGVDKIAPCTFNGLRIMVGCVSLLPVIYFSDRAKKKKGTYHKTDLRVLILGGVVCGVFLALASTLQTYGLIYTMAGKAGFITAMYMIFVPVVSVFMGKKINIKTVICVVLAMLGMYFLCVKDGIGNINKGDIMVLICAVLFTGHIMAIDYFSPKCDGVKLSCMQFFVAGVLNCIVMLAIDKPDWNLVLSCWLPILYAGAMSCGIAYTLQIIGQKHTEPTIASLLMSLESVFATLAGWLILNEVLSAKEAIGCVLAFTAIILVQLPDGLCFKKIKNR